ncbi:MAG: GPP34 family phosphoprotein [Ilumatobacteraceae bacterium]
MNLAEELAVTAIDPSSGRHALGLRSELNACLAGLLLVELLLDGVVGVGDKDDRLVVTGTAEPKSNVLAASTAVVIEAGPKVKAILSHMDRGLTQRLDLGTWAAAVAGLVDEGVLGATHGAVRSRNDVLQPFVRDAIIAKLRVAVASDAPLDPRTAALLSMTGPAHLLEVVAPDRSTRRHARDRIDHAFDGSELEPIGKMVRKVISEAATAAAAGSVAASVAATS